MVPNPPTFPEAFIPPVADPEPGNASPESFHMKCIYGMLSICCAALILLGGCTAAEGEESPKQSRGSGTGIAADINGFPESIYRAWEARALSMHNFARGQLQDGYRNYKTGEVSIEALPELTWSEALARQAKEWTNQCPKMVPAGSSRRDGMKPSIAPTPPDGVGELHLIKRSSSFVPAGRYAPFRMTGTEFERQVAELRPQMTRDGVPISKSEAAEILREQISGKIEWEVAGLPYVAALSGKKCDEAGRRPECNDFRQYYSRSTTEVGCAISRCLSDEPKLIDPVDPEPLFAEWVPVACFYTPAVDLEAAPY